MMPMLKRSRQKLDASARLRFPDDSGKRTWYVQRHLKAASRHDKNHYWITAEAFNQLKQEIVAAYGERPNLVKAPVMAESGKPSRLRSITHAAKSIAKTSIGVDRATDQQVEARLEACRHCPGNHAVWRQNGRTITPKTADERDSVRASDATVFTCGPMLEQQKRATGKTCGCILNKKARDLAEDCPNGWWPKQTTDIR